MSSEPIERRVSYLGDRLKASRCRICGKEGYYTLKRDSNGKCKDCHGTGHKRILMCGIPSLLICMCKAGRIMKARQRRCVK
jgi:hypothetical protein